MNPSENNKPAGQAIPPDIQTVLMSLGRGLGTVSVYGTKHPSVKLIVTQIHEALQTALKNGDLTIGTFNGGLTVHEKPVDVSEIPIRTLEKRLSSMKISHLVLHKGLSADELENLLVALCEPSDEAMKASLAKSGVKNINIEEVKYVTLRDGEKKIGPGGAGGGALDNIPPAQINQIIAFLKNEPGADEGSAGLKNAMTDPQKLGQMILESAVVRQQTESMASGESLADIVVGCLRRTYDGLSKENEFQSAQGKATLAKTMMLVEQTIIKKIRSHEGAEGAELDQRILAGIRNMEKERQLDMLSTHYEEQCQKREKTEKTLVELIKQLGPEKARQQLMASRIPARDWQRLMAQSNSSPTAAGIISGAGGGGVDASTIATVLDNLDRLLHLADQNPKAAENSMHDARRGINEYSLLADAKMTEIEDKVQKSGGLERDKLIMEISKLTLSLMQPLTVINGSLEAAMITVNAALHKELLELALESGQSLDKMTKRMIELTNYPELNEADDHLNEWRS